MLICIQDSQKKLKKRLLDNLIQESLSKTERADIGGKDDFCALSWG